ncbi:MAG: DUF4351 domain-containing protein [Thermosynechococcaceae cyanobacterium]
MTQQPYDQLSKQLLEELLTPLGTVQRSLEIPGEAKWVDLWFIPNAEQAEKETTDLLGRIAQRPCLLEPYRNPPSRTEIRSCVLKMLWVHEDLRRRAVQQGQTLSEQDLPLVWIIATTVSKPVLQFFGAQTNPSWGDGIYFSVEGFGTVLVSVDELPKIRETLILRLLGRGVVQRGAISDVLGLAVADPQRLLMLRILSNWKVTLELNQVEFDDRESTMAFSQAFLEWEQATEKKGLEQGEKTLVMRQLRRKVGVLPPADIKAIESLSFEQTERLGEALLDFERAEDLRVWLKQVK